MELQVLLITALPLLIPRLLTNLMVLSMITLLAQSNSQMVAALLVESTTVLRRLSPKRATRLLLQMSQSQLILILPVPHTTALSLKEKILKSTNLTVLFMITLLVRKSSLMMAVLSVESMILTSSMEVGTKLLKLTSQLQLKLMHQMPQTLPMLPKPRLLLL